MLKDGPGRCRRPIRLGRWLLPSTGRLDPTLRIGAETLLFLPKSPLMGLHYPEAEEQIGYGVGENTRSQTPGAISDRIVERAGNERG